MSEDIVVRLRESMPAYDLSVEAASVIEALRGEVATLTEKNEALADDLARFKREVTIAISDRDAAVAEAARLKETIATATKFNEGLAAENARLKGALQDCVDAYDFVIVDEYDRGWSSVSDAIHAARKALAGETT